MNVSQITAAGCALAILFALTSCSSEKTPRENAKEPANAGESAEDAPLSSDPSIAAIQTFARKVNKGSGNWRTMLPKPPKQTFSTDSEIHWDLQTTEGAVDVKLLPQVAPMHVTSTIYLTELGFYDGLSFHRVINGFMAQGGCPLGSGSGDPGYSYEGEFDVKVRHNKPGLLSMANRGPGTDGSQFFLTFVPTPHLDGKHTIFGEVVAGMDVVKKLESFGSRGGTPSKPLKIESAKIRLVAQ